MGPLRYLDVALVVADQVGSTAEIVVGHLSKDHAS